MSTSGTLGKSRGCHHNMAATEAGQKMKTYKMLGDLKQKMSTPCGYQGYASGTLLKNFLLEEVEESWDQIFALTLKKYY